MTSRLRFVLVTLAAVLTAALTARLGLWQLDRAAQKTATQDELDARAQLPPLTDPRELARDTAAAAAQQYRHAVVTGRWSNAHTVFLDNRALDGRAGFYVVTPLLLSDGRALTVQRGWAPRDAQDRTRVPTLPAAHGDVTLEGRLAPAPSRLFEFAGAETGRIRQNLDLDAYARETGLALLPLTMMQTAPAASPASPSSGVDDGLRRDWPAPATGAAKNLGYAFQWFALSALVIALYVWFQFLSPRRRRPSA